MVTEARVTRWITILIVGGVVYKSYKSYKTYKNYTTYTTYRKLWILIMLHLEAGVAEELAIIGE